MATIRAKGGRWEAIIKRSGLLPRPISLRFESERAARDYCDRLEALLDAGIIPAELQERLDQTHTAERPTLGALVRDYRAAAAITADDHALLANLVLAHGAERDLGVAWADAWVASLKRQDRLAPGSIRKRVGALSRCLDWAVRQQRIAGNPLSSLPRGYSAYTDDDARAAGTRRIDTERDRRLQPGEQERLFAQLADPAEHLLVLLALETAMRLREIYTLQIPQIDLPRRTIQLERTKNGTRRQVPLSSVAAAALAEHIGTRTTGPLLPWWQPGDDLARTTWKLSRLFGRRAKAAGLTDLRFHDLRHEATSRLFERTRLTDLQIAKITGHKDPRMLARYANLRGSDLADQLW